MAIDTTGIYRRYPEESGLESIRMRSGSDVIYDRNVFLHKTREDSMRLNDLAGPRVIISSSGMMTGGRVLHHLRRLLPAPENVIVLAGYQAPGTRGWRLKQGEPSLRIHGQDVPVKARLEEISGLSAHADCNQLLRWVRDLPPPRVTYVTHGDGEASEALARRLREELDFRCEIPALGDSHEL
jgi:metallo-beta-lactamase family protein